MAYQVTQLFSNMSTNVLLLPGEVIVPSMSLEVYESLESQALFLNGRIMHNWRLRFGKLDPGTYTLVAVAADAWTEEGINRASHASATVVLDGEEVFVPFEF